MCLKEASFKGIAVFAMLCCFLSPIFAQDTLYLYDPSERIPVVEAQVQVLSASGKAITEMPYYSDEKGRVILDNFEEEHFLLIEQTNYHTIYVNWFETKAARGRFSMTHRALDLVEVVVYGSSKIKESVKEVPNQITLIDKEDIRLYNPQTSADVLQNSGDIYVQKSQMGGGSPILRGFEANRVLIVLDGVRMNNAIYRSGHLQNVITIDNAVIDRAEVYYGPATVMYGGDAFGGVMYFSTVNPKFRTADESPFSANAYTRFSTANFERTAHFDFNLGSQKFASLSSVSYSNFGNLRAGRIKSDTSMARYWNRYFYVEQQDSMDFVRVNENPNVQVGSGYSQMDILQKFRFQPNPNTDFILNVQYSTSSNVPRYDQLTEGRVDFVNGQIISQELEYAQWDYGPQQRFMAALHANFTPDSFLLFHSANIVAAMQRIDEDRITRLFNDPLRRIQSEDVYVFTFNADFARSVGKQMNILYGVEGTHNYVSSTAKTVNILTLEESNRGLGTRYPDGGSTMSTASAYATYRWKIGNKANLIAGGRYTFTNLAADYVDSVLYELPYDNLNLNTNALTGSLGMAWDMGNQFQFNGVVATAYRTPNVDDMAKLRAKGNSVSVPNPDIKPEKGINTEITISKQFTKKVKISGTYFHTFLYDALVQKEATINGVDTMYYDGRFRKINTLVNVGKARVWGLHGGLAIEFNESAFVKGTITYTRGRDLTAAEPEPLSHIPPLYGQLAFNYKKKLFNLNLMTRFNAAKRLVDYADSSEENLDKALPTGTPAWFTINIHMSYQLNKLFSLNIGLENLLDWHYRPYGSGVSAPGQNVILCLRGSF